MRNTIASRPRLLLCASAAHCAQVLQAAAATRVHLHELQPCTRWPAATDSDILLLWALLPEGSHTTATHALETQWRSLVQQGSHHFTVQMLYGSATQQAAQLAPWIARSSSSEVARNADASCWECLDAASELKLFQHLLTRR